VYNYFKLAAAAALARYYTESQFDAPRILQRHNLIANERALYVSAILLSSKQPSLQTSIWFLNAFLAIGSVRYLTPTLHFRFNGHECSLDCHPLPDYQDLVASFMVLEGYKLREEAGNAVFVMCPSGSIRTVQQQRCSCPEYEKHSDCNHLQFVSAYVKRRLLFLDNGISQICFSPRC